VTRRTIISSLLALAVVGTVVSVTSFARKPVLGAPLRQAPRRPVVQVQAPERVPQHTRPECQSSAFIDYASDARGKAMVREAVRAYRPGAHNLRITSFDRYSAEVDELRGTVRIASYHLFRAGHGWLVDRADLYGPCTAPE
jgi:hypothetical protein